jgi:hypothetical protein
MELTPEERRRIYEEEKVRLEARQEPPAPKRSVAPVVILGVLALLVIIRIVGSAEKTEGPTSTPSPSSSTSGERTVRGTYWCGVSFDDAGQIGIAVHDGDTAAIAGMLSRGKAFQVEGGTRVVAGGGNDKGISLVHIESGFQAGRDCYISTRALQ